MADAAIHVEDVNVAEILEQEEAKSQVQEILAAFEANPAAMKVLEAAQSAADVFEIVKKFAKLKWEEFKVLFDKTVQYFREDKAKLDDETLEQVSGGSLSSWWNKWKKDIICSVIFFGCLAVGAVAGACLGGFYGGLLGFAAGAVVGTIASVSVAKAMERNEENNQ